MTYEEQRVIERELEGKQDIALRECDMDAWLECQAQLTAFDEGMVLTFHEQPATGEETR